MPNRNNDLIHVIDENEGVLYSDDYPYGIKYMMINENDIINKNKNPYYCLGPIICVSLLLFTGASFVILLFLMEHLPVNELYLNSTNITNETNTTK